MFKDGLIDGYLKEFMIEFKDGLIDGYWLGVYGRVQRYIDWWIG